MLQVGTDKRDACVTCKNKKKSSLISSGDISKGILALTGAILNYRGSVQYKSLFVKISKVMNRIKTSFTVLIVGVIILSLSSCASSPSNRKSNNRDAIAAETSNTSLATQPKEAASKIDKKTTVAMQPLNTSTGKSINTVTVKIYQSDSQCQKLVSEKVAVPAESSVNAAVGKVLKQADSGDFNIAGYRVQVNHQNSVATVDFRLLPNSKRQFASLSPCEQFALFGSLRKTLTDNSQLKIKNVRFTEQGKEIKL
ncbi:MAG: hypothetical protein U7123_27405 [Potamolinea sp.]